MTRYAYLLTQDQNSVRSTSSKKILEKIGFSVFFVNCIPHKDPVVSNKLSMEHIYEMIVNTNLDDQHAYVFEDDLGIHQDISLDEIIKFEKLSDMFFYLGICEARGTKTNKETRYSIYGHRVISVAGNVRGLHAIGISVEGAKRLLDLIKKSTHKYMDMIVEDFSRIYPANVVRYDLQSSEPSHRGIIFQDRKRFPTSIK